MTRRGFAVPLAVLVLIVLALLAALGIDAALGALRTGDAASVEARAVARAESGLAKAFVQPLDSAARRLAAGSPLFAFVDPEIDTVIVRAQVVEPGVTRVTATAVARRGRFRGIAGRYAFATIVADSPSSAGAILRPLPTRWWTAIP
jgi:hypothetical protein